MAASKKTPRDHLNDYDIARIDIERLQLAIEILEGASVQAEKSIGQVLPLLRAEAQKALRRLDRAAAALGAPYPGR